MINDILTAAGIEYRRSRFLKPPAGAYAVYFDDVEVEGADTLRDVPAQAQQRIYRHDVTVELYEAKPDDKAEAAIEAELNRRGIFWTKEDRYWLQDVQRYQVIYNIEFIEIK